jgi:hypothetical protein
MLYKDHHKEDVTTEFGMPKELSQIDFKATLRPIESGSVTKLASKFLLPWEPIINAYILQIIQGGIIASLISI